MLEVFFELGLKWPVITSLTIIFLCVNTVLAYLVLKPLFSFVFALKKETEHTIETMSDNIEKLEERATEFNQQLAVSQKETEILIRDKNSETESKMRREVREEISDLKKELSRQMKEILNLIKQEIVPIKSEQADLNKAVIKISEGINELSNEFSYVKGALNNDKNKPK